MDTPKRAHHFLAGGANCRMMRLGVVSNSLSTRNRFGLAAVRDLLSRHPTIPHFEVAGLSEVPRAVARLAEQRVDTVVVNGGDGTTVTLVTELAMALPSLTCPV